MKNKLIALLIIAGIAGTIAGFCVISSLVGLSGSVNDWFVHVQAGTLVNGSERIVVARFLDELTHEIPLPPTADSYSAVSVAQLHRRFEVVEPLKGNTRPGDAFHVVWPAGVTVKVANTGDLEFLPYDVILLSAGEIYVLFLNRSSRRSAYSEGSPRTLWELTWGPDVARIGRGGRLIFKSDQHYRNALRDMDLRPVRDSGAPFELTIQNIRELVLSSPTPAP